MFKTTLKSLGILLSMAGAIASGAVDGMVVPTLAVNLPEQVKYLLPNRPPHVPLVRQVARHQPFFIHVFIVKPEIRDGAANVTWSATLKRPDGSTSELGRDLTGIVGPCTGNGVFLSPSFFTVKLDDHEKSGIYEFQVTFFDRTGHSAVEKIAKVQLIDFADDGSVLEGMAWERYLMSYYREPHPEKFFAALRGFLAAEPVLRPRKGYDPTGLLTAFAGIVRRNPQLIAPLASFAKKTDDDMAKSYIALLLNAAGRDMLAAARIKIDPATKLFMEKIGSGDPLAAPVEVKKPGDLDRLWAEFFITGRREPLMKIANEMRKRDTLVPDDMKKIRDSNREPTPEELAKFNNFVLTAAAFRSLTANVGVHQLVFFYMEGAVTRNELAGPDVTGMVKAAVRKAVEARKSKAKQSDKTVKPVSGKPQVKEEEKR